MPIHFKFKKFTMYALNIFFSVIEGFLMLRLLLKVLGANQSIFVNWVYDVSGSILRPFEGMFEPLTSSGGHILEFTTIFTIFFYGIIYFFIYQIILVLTDVVQKNTKKKQEESNDPYQTPLN